MHVLILPSWYPADEQDINGAFFREQAIALKKQGVTVGVISISLLSLRKMRNIFSYTITRVSVTEEEDIPTYRKSYRNWFYKIPILGKAWYVLVARKLFLRYVKEQGYPDIIHVHSMIDAGIAAMHIKIRYGIPYVVTEHSSAFSLGLHSRSELTLIKKIADQSSKNIAVSSPFANILHTKTGKEWGIIPNIVHERFFRNICIPVDRSVFRFINICFLKENKKVDLLIKAFSSEFKGNHKIQLYIGGTGDQLQKLNQLASDLELEDQVVFLGALSRSQVMEEVEKADVFVLTSEFETFGVVLIEALALGKPVISTRSGGPEDIVDEKNGLLVPTNNSEALGKAMQYMVENYNTYNPQEIQQRCHEKFSEASVAKRLVNVYQQVLTKSP
ncbi:glycosyltransferase [Sphaerochaeta sp.]|jgi:glycosyltransferase involved in cell wall biosynthesis|uniref:glycosyltransferase n=1 Tax=Sphaerochaeta sp. TaxID=1972642 RepID=UPI002A35ED75|nr:glycosyltransferase [Sphaerochaeta sp.]MDX9984626.1 glycosyltransferase [Sphaerochaeta sp.]